MGLTITTEPIQYEIEVIKVDTKIPDEDYPDFTEWLSNRPLYDGVGKRHNYFCNGYNNDIEVSYEIRLKR